MSCGPAEASGWYCTLKTGQRLVPHAFERVVVEVDVRRLDVARAASSGSTAKPWFCVVISTLPGPLVQHRLVGAAVAELELERLRPERQAEQLMAEADAEDRLLAEQVAGWCRSRSRRRPGSPGPLERKMPSGLWRSTSSAVAVPGTTVTWQPTCVRQRRMFHFMPKSMATTCCVGRPRLAGRARRTAPKPLVPLERLRPARPR